MSPEERVKRVLDNTVGSDLSSWERFEFFPNIRGQVTLSPNQERVMRQIEKRVLNTQREEND